MKCGLPIHVIPAHAGIPLLLLPKDKLDPRVRGDDDRG